MSVQLLDDDLRKGTPRIGLWLDTLMNVAETFDYILVHLEDSAIR